MVIFIPFNFPSEFGGKNSFVIAFCVEGMSGEDDKHKCFSYEEAFEGSRKHEIKRKSFREKLFPADSATRGRWKSFQVNRSLMMLRNSRFCAFLLLICFLEIEDWMNECWAFVSLSKGFYEIFTYENILITIKKIKIKVCR